MTKVKLVSISCFLKHLALVESENIPPADKETEEVSVRKICLIKLFLCTL